MTTLEVVLAFGGLCFFLSELDLGADASLDIGLGHLVTDEMAGFPAGAMPRDYDVWLNCCQVFDCLWDDLFEYSTG